MATTFIFGRYAASILFGVPDQTKIDAAIIQTTTIPLQDYPVGVEVVRARVDWSGPALTSRTQVQFEWKNEDTGQVIFRWETFWDRGWTGAWATAWIGHKAAGEIDRPGNYSVFIGGPGLFQQTINFTVTAPPEPVPVPEDNLAAKIIRVVKYYFEVSNDAEGAVALEPGLPKTIIDIIKKIFTIFTTVNVAGPGQPEHLVAVIPTGGIANLVDKILGKAVAKNIEAEIIEASVKKIEQTMLDFPERIADELITFTTKEASELSTRLMKSAQGQKALAGLTESFVAREIVKTPLSSIVIKKLLETFGEKTPLALAGKIAILLAGGSGIATWLASDNIVTGSVFPLNRLKTLVDEGTITKTEALKQIKLIQEWKDFATQFINTSTIANPLLWLFRGIFLVNTELAQTNIDQIKLQIGVEEEAVPTGTPEEEVIVPLVPIVPIANAWKYTFKTIRADTQEPISAKLFINGEDTGKWTPWFVYLEPSTTYVIRFERFGFFPAEVTITTDVLPG